MIFTEPAIILREVCNGMMFIASLFVLGVFIVYVVRSCYRLKLRKCFQDVAVQAAIAIIILVAGHSIRAFSGWMEFLWLDLGYQSSLWINTFETFLAATALIVIGKMMITYIFSAYQWRYYLMVAMGTATVMIPIVVAVLSNKSKLIID